MSAFAIPPLGEIPIPIHPVELMWSWKDKDENFATLPRSSLYTNNGENFNNGYGSVLADLGQLSQRLIKDLPSNWQISFELLYHGRLEVGDGPSLIFGSGGRPKFDFWKWGTAQVWFLEVGDGPSLIFGSGGRPKFDFWKWGTAQVWFLEVGDGPSLIFGSGGRPKFDFWKWGTAQVWFLEVGDGPSLIFGSGGRPKFDFWKWGTAQVWFLEVGDGPSLIFGSGGRPKFDFWKWGTAQVWFLEVGDGPSLIFGSGGRPKFDFWIGVERKKYLHFNSKSMFQVKCQGKIELSSIACRISWPREQTASYGKASVQDQC